MKVVRRNGRIYRISGSTNEFQEALYIHLIDWKRKHVTSESGESGGQTYDAILPPEIGVNWPHIYEPIRLTVTLHQQRFPFRFHKFFFHMASSQAANMNLFLPILHSGRAAEILRAVKPDFARLATEQLDNGYQIEYCDGFPGSLGDKTDVSGTDADIAIAYYNHENELCLWLVEHKLSEAEFTACGGYKSKGRKSKHDCAKSFAELVAGPESCYYHDVRGFKYWQATKDNAEFFPEHAAIPGCPFRGGMNQLWRNQLLALSIEKKGSPFVHVSFSVVRHPRNEALDKSLEAYQRLIGKNPKFHAFTSREILDAAAPIVDDGLNRWLAWYRELYAV